MRTCIIALPIAAGLDAEKVLRPGELFDLEALARSCQELQRWSFFVASVPLNMPGGVSSPPNVMAIF